MSVIKRKSVEVMSTSFRLAVEHFAMGTYPVLDNTWMMVNRIFCVLENPGGNTNYIEGGESRIPLEPGTVCVIPSYLPAIFKLDDNLKFISIQMRLELLAGIDIFSACQEIILMNEPEIHRRIVEIYKNSSDLTSAMALNGLIYEIAYRLMARLPENYFDNMRRFENYAPLIHYIQSNCQAGMGVSDLAAFMGMRRESFSRRFSADTGLSPKQFFNRFLVKRAADLLRDSRLSIRECAFAIGFQSEYYFSRFFKQHTGLTPSKYRHNPLHLSSQLVTFLPIDGIPPLLEDRSSAGENPQGKNHKKTNKN